MKRFLKFFVRIHTRPVSFPLYCAGFALWMYAGHQWGFDPYPFGLLTLAVSLLAILLGIATLVTASDIETWTESHIEHMEAMEQRLSDEQAEVAHRVCDIADQLHWMRIYLEAQKLGD